MHSGQNLLSCMPKYIALNKSLFPRSILPLTSIARLVHVFDLDLTTQIFMAYAEQVWHGETKIWVVRSRSFTWTSPAMLVKSISPIMRNFTFDARLRQCPSLFHTATVKPKIRGRSLLYRTPLICFWFLSKKSAKSTIYLRTCTLDLPIHSKKSRNKPGKPGKALLIRQKVSKNFSKYLGLSSAWAGDEYVGSLLNSVNVFYWTNNTQLTHSIQTHLHVNVQSLASKICSAGRFTKASRFHKTYRIPIKKLESVVRVVCNNPYWLFLDVGTL